MVRFGPKICHNLEAALQHAWLETHGFGDFASSKMPGFTHLPA